MNKIFIQLTLTLLLTLFAWNCSKNNNPLNQNNDSLNEEEMLSGNLEIKTEKLDYTLEDVSAENFITIVASLINNSKDTLYAKLGDRINESMDQDYLSLARGTDGHFEKNVSSNKWDNLNLPIMVEGSKVIRILPSKIYNLVATANLDESIEGNFRLRVNYYKSYNKDIVDTLTDVSNIFSISKK